MTERPFQLQVRAQRASDWESLYAMREEPGVRYNVLAVPFTDPDQVRERVARYHEGSHRLIAEALLPDGTRRVVGQLGLWVEKLSGASRGGLGIQVSTAYQGMGVGSALMAAMCDLADNWLNLHRVELEVFTDNQRGIALYKKFSFEIEATLRRYAYRDGHYTDAHMMGRLNPHHLSPDLEGGP